MEAERNKKFKYTSILSPPPLPRASEITHNSKLQTVKMKNHNRIKKNNTAAPPEVSHTVYDTHTHTHTHTHISDFSTYRSSEHVVHESAQAPPVNSLPMSNSLQNFRGPAWRQKKKKGQQ